MSDSLRPHGLHHTRPLCSPLYPGICSNSCPLSWWGCLTISSSVPLLLLPLIFSSIRVFSNELGLHIMLTKYWSFTFSLSPSTKYFFRVDWCDLLAVQGTLKSLFQLLLLLSHFSRVRLYATPWTAAYQAPSSLGFSRQEHWSGLPFPSPMHESEK